MQLNLGRLFLLPVLLLSLGLALTEARTPILKVPSPSPYNPNPPRGGVLY
uniref:Metchnikowin n=1 Tax=Drosophila testacea TaxID=38838 RepID=A0A6B9KCE7_9MUSC|nr:metchnikowin [Drosophila testacea]